MSVTKLHQLPLIFGGDLHREAARLVERARDSIAWRFHSRDETFRLLIYSEFIDQACEALLRDGGPAVALQFLKGARDSCAVRPRIVLATRSAPS